MTKKHTLSPEQDLAANPQENVWVQANAGTGKTSVLVQRLLRILFRNPENSNYGILCLTYTNAGAGEMRNRILKSLREWAAASDNELGDMLYDVVERRPVTSDDVAHARRIFFFYIDNPDVLKIKTIHGFCEEILHRFPTEAGIAPAWSLVSDDAQRILLQDAFEQLITSPDIDDQVGVAFTHIIGRVSEFTLPKLLGILSDRCKYFFDTKNDFNYRKQFIDTTYNFLNLKPNTNDDIDPKKLQNIIKLAQNAQNMRKSPAQFLTDIINATKQYIEKTIDFEKYKSIYLKDSGDIKAVITKQDFLLPEAERIYNINQRNINKQIFDDTIAMFDLSAAFANKYHAIKQSKNVLDFEDLILYTKKLFSNPETMGWILSQLDLTLSHILVDEAQDTSPVQWDILRMLAGDFFVNGNTANEQRSLFVVGDSKQSIYGFQGADPQAFIYSRDEIGRQIEFNKRTIQEVPLTQSFRSAPQILSAVDTFFMDDTVRHTTGFVNNTHKCFRNDADGMVKIHKIKSKKQDNTTIEQYISNIAKDIQSVLSTKKYTPSDIMVLVQNRHPLAPRLVKELKKHSIAVAGSDRIILPNFPAIRDLLNLVRFCLNPADNYSLCCVLRSPFYRMNIANIFNLCQIRNNENKHKKSENKDYIPTTVFEVLQTSNPDTYHDLETILSWSKTMGPYTFFDTFLSHNNMRKNMIAALGNQVIDPLEEFMTICLAYERTTPGTLKSFIKDFITGNSQIKRDMDSANGVRIVTVHGSKGLEAPVVFLIDTVNTPNTDNIIPIPGASTNLPTWLWAPRTNNSALYAAAVQDVQKTHIAEYYRLLYVAMTRARDELHIYGFTNNTSAPEISWHSQLWRVFESSPKTEKTDEIIRIKNV